jgi:hypothetical protein
MRALASVGLTLVLASSALFLAAPPQMAHAATPAATSQEKTVTVTVGSFLSLSGGGDVSATLTPSNGTASTKEAASAFLVNTNNPGGYHLAAQVKGSSNAMTGTSPNADTLAATADSTTTGDGPALTGQNKGAWGYRVNKANSAPTSGAWLAMPASSTTPTQYTSGSYKAGSTDIAAADIADLNSSAGPVASEPTTVQYGFTASPTLAADAYTATVTYTLVPNV